MQALTRFSLRNPVAVLLLAVLVIAGGILSALRLNEELMPDIALPVIAVITPYPGASPEEVADHVSQPIEDALRGLGDVKNVTSVSMQNVSEVELELNLNSNLDDVQQKVHEALQQMKLPDGTMTPTVQKFSFNAQPVVYFTVASDRQDDRALRDAVHDVIVPALQGVPGVASVQTAGGAPDEVRIQVSQDKLRQHHLTLEQVLQAIQASNVTMPLGTATLSGQVQAVQMAGAVRSLDDIRNIRIPLPADPSAGLSAIGESIGQMGQAVGQVGQAVGQVAQGLGQVGQGLAVVQGETQLLAALQQIQGQIWGTQLALAQEQARPPGSQDPQRVAELTAALQALQREQDALNQRLKSLQGQLPPASAGSPPPSAAPSVPAAPPAVKNTSGPSSLDSVRLGDIADVTLAPPRDGAINRTNGQPSVMVSVLKAEDANTVQMADGVNAQLAELAKRLPAGVHIVPLFDSSTMIRSSIGGMLREAVLGALFAAAVILLFLRNWRTTVIAVVSIPLSLMCAIILLHRLDITLNIMTLGGMAVATGRVVDDSIVVIENIHRHWRQRRGEGKALALAATREVGAAITASTITTIAVFLPLGFVSGIVGKIFLPFALTVVCALASSLLVALTVVPLLAWLLVLRAPGAREADGQGAEGAQDRTEETALERSSAVPAQAGFTGGQRALRPWQRTYQRFLNACLNHKAAVLTVTAAAFAGSVLILPLAGSTFIPESREKFATIQVEMPVGTPRDATDAKARQVEQVVRSFGDTVQQMNTQVGSDAGQTDSDGSVRGTNTASFFLELKPDTDVPAFVAQLRDKLKAIAPPADIQVKELILGGASGSFGVVVTGPNPDHIAQAAAAITSALGGLPGLANVQNNLARTQPQVNIQPDPAKAAPYGLTAYAIASQVRAALAGEDAGQATLDGRTYNVVLTLQGSHAPQKLEDIRSFQLETPTGQRVALSDVATVHEVQAPVTVLHRNGAGFAEVTGDFTDQDTGRTTKLAMQRIQSLGLPADVDIQLGGDAQEQNESFRQLVQATLIAAGLVYLVMLVSFGEWTAPFAILFSMPVALIGAFAGTVIARQPVSVSSLIGILMLMGIVVTNAIVLVDRVERQRRQGLGVREALLEAGTTRLRPILMTAIATICALIPLALGFAEGALISQGLAVVVIGGLLSSTALTLVVVPVVYEILHRRARRQESLAMRPNFG
ncbi:efflux RND transporter permease subunit [Alicyclobacillus macrosporangiidus]|uniref:Hydrophobic/amphiphilic exporter-1, HAE1 family n=1 Tax=Alicyclobacillus macrosporangiidus TaxID=392015 RepID=A0A1I7K2K1_9BACL|nr:efflux RND transporter permease subunit [Alicyclobacillus macrosporangiidus]SFU91654.1 hydrophobic/amphiphilic exporter-1, HAE1 family [Alicyclobacillus macrosporangiidus]